MRVISFSSMADRSRLGRVLVRRMDHAHQPRSPTMLSGHSSANSRKANTTTRAFHFAGKRLHVVLLPLIVNVGRADILPAAATATPPPA
jgi:hypothetical protein